MNEKKERKAFVANILLSAITAGFCFVVIEIGYRIIDPYEKYHPWQVAQTKNSNIYQYDPTLGWKGIPRISEYFTIWTGRALVEHNSLGFRDIEPAHRTPQKPAVLFLGDSFTWGYGIDYEDMFVNRVRKKIPQYEVFNLGHNGYGTDQALLTFRQWQEDRPLARAVLMFCSLNDLVENNSAQRYFQHKPKFELVNGTLTLTNTPVPQPEKKKTPSSPAAAGPGSVAEWAKYLIFQSHFLSDLNFRLRHPKQYEPASAEAAKEPGSTQADPLDFSLTREIIRRLHTEVLQRGGQLTLIRIPTHTEFIANQQPAHIKPLQATCEQLEIDYLDLADHFRTAPFRTYFRAGVHWNRYGHKIAAEKIYAFLVETGLH